MAPNPSLPGPIESVLASLFGGPDQEFWPGVARLCEQHPGEASAIRRVAEQLQATARGMQPQSTQALAQGGEGDRDLKPGDRVGAFVVREEIGHGGMGDVYLAEQREPVRRRVALKVIRLGLDTKAMLARFEAERQALAMMDHSHIAKVFEAGATPTGRPYFAMEFVKGAPITRYCDENKLSLEDRLLLFKQVCSGVQHAHTKGVIHRDLTPNNVLVTVQDGKASTKIIDFGLARATDQRLTERTLFTERGVILGTPEYMSPEQAGLNALDIDMRSDVYTLGVLLYELLTGKLPFEGKALRAEGYDGMCKTIREAEPPRPSTKVTTHQGGTEGAAKLRRTDASTLLKRLRGDLDWIVLKCLEKDRTRRYETVSQLADDVERYLGSEPVIARAPSAAYRVAKFARRYRGQLLAMAGVFAALVGGLGLAIYFWRDAAAQAAEATRQAGLAETARAGEAAKAKELGRSLASERAALGEARWQALVGAADRALEREQVLALDLAIRAHAERPNAVTADVLHRVLRALREDQVIYLEGESAQWAGFLPEGALAVVGMASGPMRWSGRQRVGHWPVRSRVATVVQLAGGGGPAVAFATLDGALVHWQPGKVPAVFAAVFPVRPGAEPYDAIASALDGGSILTARQTPKPVAQLVRVGDGRVVDLPHDAAITAIAALGDGGWATGGRKFVRTWNADGSARGSLPIAEDQAVSSLVGLADGSVVAGLRTGTLIRLGPEGPPATAIAAGEVVRLHVTPDGHRLISGTQSGRVHSWRLPDLAESMVLPHHGGMVTAIDILPDSSLIATGGADGMIHLVRGDGQPAGTLRIHQNAIKQLTFDARTRRLLSTSVDRTLRVSRLDAALPDLTPAPGPQVGKLLFVREDGSFLARRFPGRVAHGDCTSGVVGLLSGVPHDNAQVTSMAVSPDHRWLAFARVLRSMRLHSVVLARLNDGGADSALIARNLDAELRGVGVTQLTPGNLRLVAVLQGGGQAAPRLLVWDVAAEAAELPAPRSASLPAWERAAPYVQTAELRPGGDLVAVAGRDGRVHLVSPADGATVQTLEADGTERAVESVEWSSDGATLLCSSAGRLDLWRRGPDGAFAGSRLLREDNFIADATLVPDASLIAIATTDGRARVLDARGNVLFDFHDPTPGARLLTARITPDHRGLLTTTSDGRVTRWILDHADLQRTAVAAVRRPLDPHEAAQRDRILSGLRAKDTQAGDAPAPRVTR